MLVVVGHLVALLGPGGRPPLPLDDEVVSEGGISQRNCDHIHYARTIIALKATNIKIVCQTYLDINKMKATM